MEQTQKRKTSKPKSPEFRENAVRLAMEHRDAYHCEAAALTAIADEWGCSPDRLRVLIRQVQCDGGERPGQTSAEKARTQELKREVHDLNIRSRELPGGRSVALRNQAGAQRCEGARISGGDELVPSLLSARTM